MAGIENLIRANEDGTLSFGDDTLAEKKKKEGFSHEGDLYKVKTYRDITRLEKNEGFVYESVPGTVVREFSESENGMQFLVDGTEDAQITVGLSDETAYDIRIDGKSIGSITTDLGGKLSFGAELKDRTTPAQVEIVRA
jgi:hypothetical protein